MNRRLRNALVVTAAITSGFLMTACGGGETDDSSAAESDPSIVQAADASPSPSAAKDKSAASSGSSRPTAKSGSGSGTSGSGSSGSGSGTGTAADSAADTSGDEAADKTGYGQSCGTNDLVWKATEMTQGGGYYQISVKAKSGITCALPGGLPSIAFGSGGTEAGPAEQVAGDEITLSGSKTVYAGVNPKTTNDDLGTEYTTVIASVSDEDPNPVSLSIGNALVNEPIVTNWHTNAQDAVPLV
ncbi:DUF4232 domain-containing protein [Streptomyces sp. NBC_00102]|uniref:DUF4232 domain-containing protein n=1 Tax=Streptomyces sp. NBC_00102 TaxID=2975652 RepID=UPI00224DB810|nr:DUF4232 domain-containing protein [Streptomyces sp. NBC_00102]MCX5400489.1 DUF4232 domain-containing protein [Streptomyces sp. NBC_00102]